MEGRKLEFDKVFRALGDKHRLYIMDLLMEREMNAGELLEKVNVVQSTLSHHMKCLCESGLVIARKERKWTYYSVSREAVEAAGEFLKRYLTGVSEDAQAPEKVQVPEKTDIPQKNAVPDRVQQWGVDEQKNPEEEAAEMPGKADVPDGRQPADAGGIQLLDADRKNSRKKKEI